MKKFRSGLVVGKFSPLHLGHEFLIRTAAEQCELLTVINYSNPSLSGCPIHERTYWLKQFQKSISSNIEVFVLDDNLPHNDDPELGHRLFCAKYLLDTLERTVDVVFSSETYGAPFAEYLSTFFTKELKSKHRVDSVLVDLQRTKYPISGTVLRADLIANSEFVSLNVLGSFIPRVAILGGESSGKSTLTRSLSQVTSLPMVEEYGRELFEELGGNLRYEDMEIIAKTQIGMERVAGLRYLETNYKALQNAFIFCDTTPLTTSFYSTVMFDRVSRLLSDLKHREYQYYILCANDIQFDQDGTRRDEEFRKKGYIFYKKWLEDNNLPYLEVSGNREDRVNQVLDWIKYESNN